MLCKFLKSLFSKPKKTEYIPKPAIYTTKREDDFLTLVNNYRIANGLKPLYAEQENYKASKLRTQELQKQGKLSHDTFDPIRESLTDLGLNYAGENIAWRYTDVKEAFRALTNSPKHNKNMLNKRWEFTGISITDDNYYCQIFSR